jgi:hypothetical protein
MYIYEPGFYFCRSENGTIQRKAGNNPTAGCEFSEAELPELFESMRGRKLNNLIFVETDIRYSISKYKTVAEDLGFTFNYDLSIIRP